jgi:hypothetical protein
MRPIWPFSIVSPFDRFACAAGTVTLKLTLSGGEQRTRGVYRDLTAGARAGQRV